MHKTLKRRMHHERIKKSEKKSCFDSFIGCVWDAAVATLHCVRLNIIRKRFTSESVRHLSRYSNRSWSLLSPAVDEGLLPDRGLLRVRLMDGA